MLRTWDFDLRACSPPAEFFPMSIDLPATAPIDASEPAPELVVPRWLRAAATVLTTSVAILLASAIAVVLGLS
jgi:hypothetical protein